MNCSLCFYGKAAFLMLLLIFFLGSWEGFIGRLFSFAFCWPLGVFLRIQQVARVHPLHLLVYFRCVCMHICMYICGLLKKI